MVLVADILWFRRFMQGSLVGVLVLLDVRHLLCCFVGLLVGFGGRAF